MQQRITTLKTVQDVDRIIALLENIAHTKSIRGVVTKGKWLDRAALNGLLQKAKK